MTKSFGEQLRDYVGNPASVIRGKYAVFAIGISIIICLLIGLVGYGFIPGGKGLYYGSFYVMAVVLALAAALTLGTRLHAAGNPDVAPTFGVGAITLTLGLAAVAFAKDMGSFQTVLGS
jgi:hypothetical protein